MIGQICCFDPVQRRHRRRKSGQACRARWTSCTQRTRILIWSSTLWSVSRNRSTRPLRFRCISHPRKTSKSSACTRSRRTGRIHLILWKPVPSTTTPLRSLRTSERRITSKRNNTRIVSGLNKSSDACSMRTSRHLQNFAHLARVARSSTTRKTADSF